mmetsp:Transcript_68699/g.201102  ORF Transcript_68699/g.201102 Transcript_68699/m.201102 type:complete len:237 (+) Transcript_68699:47-757(+)
MFACLSDCKCLDADDQEILAPSCHSRDRRQTARGEDEAVEVLKKIAAEERRYREEERKQQQDLQRRTDEARALRRAEEEARRQSQDMAQKMRDLQKAFKEEQARYEQIKRERELLERTTQAKEEEAQKSVEERERWLRKTAVTAFLKEHGFASVTSSKKGMMKATFPLHVAAEAGNSKMVDMLIKEGADPEERNSQGKTAAQVAQAAQARKGGLDDCHEAVLTALAGSGRARMGGA